jgi:hypothetical protein
LYSNNVIIAKAANFPPVIIDKINTKGYVKTLSEIINYEIYPIGSGNYVIIQGEIDNKPKTIIIQKQDKK